MWQRVQSLYLGIATLLIASLFWCDAANVVAEDGTVEHIAYTDKIVYAVWICVLTVMQAASLLGFKWRMKQMRLSVVTAIMCFGFQVWLAVDYFQNRSALVMSWTALFPLAAFVMDMLAAKNIFSDELMVRSSNRLRSARHRKQH